MASHSKCKARDLFSGGFELLICCIGSAEITLLACLLGLPLLLRGSLVHQKIKWCLHNGWQQVLHLDSKVANLKIAMKSCFLTCLELKSLHFNFHRLKVLRWFAYPETNSKKRKLELWFWILLHFPDFLHVDCPLWLNVVRRCDGSRRSFTLYYCCFVKKCPAKAPIFQWGSGVPVSPRPQVRKKSRDVLLPFTLYSRIAHTTKYFPDFCPTHFATIQGFSFNFCKLLTSFQYMLCVCTTKHLHLLLAEMVILFDK